MGVISSSQTELEERQSQIAQTHQRETSLEKVKKSKVKTRQGLKPRVSGWFTYQN
jgi:hypothetical protein